MDRFGHIFVQIRNLKPKVALHSILLALKPNKFGDSLWKKPLVAWTSCANKTNATTSKWKKYPDSRIKSDKSDKMQQTKRKHEGWLTQVEQEA